MNQEIQKLNMNESVDTCPVCGYTDGFHASFKVLKGAAMAVILICPQCHTRFDAGWEIKKTGPSSLEEESLSEQIPHE